MQGGRPRTTSGHTAALEPPGWTQQRRHRGAVLMVMSLIVTMLVALPPGAVQAQASTQVTGLTAEQDHGFTTLRWDPVAGAGQYEIERTPVDENGDPTADSVVVGVWRPERQVSQEVPTFADAGFVPGDRFQWRVRALLGGGLPNLVTIDEPSSAAGSYEAQGASFGPALDETGISGEIVVVNSTSGVPSQGCGPLTDFPTGAVALADRGSCPFVDKARNAQAAGAVALIVANDSGGAPINMGGNAADVTIPSVMIWRDDGDTIKAGLPASGTVQSNPPGPFSEPVVDTTLPMWGDPDVPGENLRTQWEQTEAAQFTNDVNEYAYTGEVAAASDRVRVVELGRTVQDRPINMFIIGYPTPPATAEEVAAGSTAMINCNVHGNEPSSREACLIMARQLAFGNDARTIDILSNTTVLIIPAINGDGRANNTRGNVTGQDLNRDHSLLRQPETFAFATAVRDYKPQTAFDGHEFGNSNAGDLPVLMPRHLNVPETIFATAKSLIEDWLYVQGSEDGWWYCPYGCQGGGNVGLSQETILRNTLGLKNVIGTLLEARSSGGTTRPNQGGSNSPAYRRLKTYSALYTYERHLDYHHANRDALAQAVADGEAFQISNTGRIVFRGSRPIPAFPAPHPGQAPPPDENPSASEILEDPPCGYLLTEEQYNGPLSDQNNLPEAIRTTAAQRLAAHGWAVEERPAGYLVRMSQPQRGLIPLLLDGQAAEPLLDAERLMECPHAQVDPDSISTTAVEDTQTTVELTVSNIAVEPDEDLDWTITEAASDCSDPSDLGWVGVDPASGTTASSSSTTVDVTFDATGLTAPDVHTGVLCLSSNDPGEPLIEIPIQLQVQYPMAGFVAPIANPPAFNPVNANQSVPVKFSLGGDRGLSILADGSPASQAINCTTLDPIGPLVPTQTAGGSGLAYDAGSDTYTYNWKTERSWRDSCRQLIVTLDDTSEHLAYFRFR